MNIITSNKAQTIGVVSDIPGLLNLGQFRVQHIREWLQQVELVLGDDEPVMINFKLSDNPLMPAYMICACHENADPRVAICGEYPSDGGKWGECDK